MPPTASRVASQFTPCEFAGRTSMVVCNHCQQQKLPKNSLQRKEEHLRNCSAFQMSPLATETDINGHTLLEDSISRRCTRTKPGNSRVNGEKEMLRLQRIGAVLMAGGGAGQGGNQGMGLQERVERIIRGEGGRDATDPESTYSGHAFNAYSPYSSPHGFQPQNTSDTAANANSNETMAALLQSATRSTPSNTNNPRKRTLPDDLHDTATPERAVSATPGGVSLFPHSATSAAHTSTFISGGGLGGGLGGAGAETPSAKRLKNAELYLDEHDYEFLCSAQGPREIRMAAMVERLARLVRLRDRG